jgi:hypothetical protein
MVKWLEKIDPPRLQCNDKNLGLGIGMNRVYHNSCEYIHIGIELCNRTLLNKGWQHLFIIV